MSGFTGWWDFPTKRSLSGRGYTASAEYLENGRSVSKGNPILNGFKIVTGHGATVEAAERERDEGKRRS
jgi:hypothetical protein